MVRGSQLVLFSVCLCLLALGVSAFLSSRNVHEYEDLIGHKLDEFKEKVRNRGINIVRVVEVDGVAQMITKDIRSDRMNVRTITQGDNSIVIGIAGFH
mmetsp:Transcript_15981/g.20405  ORF Transcript_15981/g.20405 Transcript_15981/m.20405 type:complete len:98 (+) Transcript_15981:38-331(+)